MNGFNASGTGCASHSNSPRPAGRPRLQRADRRQMVWEARCLDEQLPADHTARQVVELVERCWRDFALARLEDAIESREGHAGRPGIDPRILVSLWLYAAMNDVGRGRELDRLCREHDAYRWICGGVSVNYHTLNDFRVGHATILDEALSAMLAVLVRGGVVKAEQIAHDGTRVRASAGSSSFRREKTLEELLPQARAHVQRLKEQVDGGESSRERAAHARAARERQERIEAALAEIPSLREAKERARSSHPSKTKAIRVSTTDPEARVMKMPDGGYRPAYNVQVAVDTASRAIVGVRVTNQGSDANLSEPMRREVEQRTGVKAKEYLVDGGYAQHESVEAAAEAGVVMYAPVKESRKPGIDPHAPKARDSEAVAAWRARMGTEEAKAIYNKRCSTVETINADLKDHRGLGRINVRGLAKAKCVVLWSSLAYMVMQFGSHLLTLR